MSAAGEVRLYMALQKAAHAFKKRADNDLMAAADLTTAQSAVLVVINAEEGATQRSVASALSLNESAVTAMIRKLMGRGLIDRQRSTRDARAWSLQLTKKGEVALAATAAPFTKLNEHIDTEMGMEAVKQLAAQLGMLTKSLSKNA